MKDFDEWSEDYEVGRNFDADTIAAVHGVLINRWYGSRTNANGRQVSSVAFKSRVWTAATICNPYYTPKSEEYTSQVDDEVLDYVQSVTSLITPYLDNGNLDDQLLVMQAELNEMVMRRGKWGELIEKFQRSLPEPPVELTSHIEKEIFRQNHMRHVRSFWETIGKKELPLCANLDIRLSLVSIQSADVERMCKAHSIIHTKNRNKLKHLRVKKPLYCYINMHITDDDSADPDDFLISVQYDEDDNHDIVVVGEGDTDEGNDENDGVLL